MEYIFLVIAMLVCESCVAMLFIEVELAKCICTYQNGELKIIKRRNGQVVYRKVLKGKVAKWIYKIFC